MRVNNQVHPPRPKKARVDSLGNHKKRMWVKCGTSSMLFIDSITDNAARAFEEAIYDMALKLGVKLKCTFATSQ